MWILIRIRNTGISVADPGFSAFLSSRSGMELAASFIGYSRSLPTIFKSLDSDMDLANQDFAVVFHLEAPNVPVFYLFFGFSGDLT